MLWRDSVVNTIEPSLEVPEYEVDKRPVLLRDFRIAALRYLSQPRSSPAISPNGQERCTDAGVQRTSLLDVAAPCDDPFLPCPLCACALRSRLPPASYGVSRAPHRACGLLPKFHRLRQKSYLRCGRDQVAPSPHGAYAEFGMQSRSETDPVVAETALRSCLAFGSKQGTQPKTRSKLACACAA